ncbi:hypothetical protein PWT90_05490 [Aphanocladium album]|nr:hypothetical protein PWT90_05490 [Aphanocladium album]
MGHNHFVTSEVAVLADWLETVKLSSNSLAPASAGVPQQNIFDTIRGFVSAAGPNEIVRPFSAMKIGDVESKGVLMSSFATNKRPKITTKRISKKKEKVLLIEARASLASHQGVASRLQSHAFATPQSMPRGGNLLGSSLVQHQLKRDTKMTDKRTDYPENLDTARGKNPSSFDLADEDEKTASQLQGECFQETSSEQLPAGQQEEKLCQPINPPQEYQESRNQDPRPSSEWVVIAGSIVLSTDHPGYTLSTAEMFCANIAL